MNTALWSQTAQSPTRQSPVGAKVGGEGKKQQTVSPVLALPATIIAGSTSLGAGYSGDGGSATRAQLRSPRGIAVDNSGNIFIADTLNNVIRKIDVAGRITTLKHDQPLPNGSGDYLHPQGIVVDRSGNLFVSDASHVVWRVDSVHRTSTIFAGIQNEHGYNGDGRPARGAMLCGPAGLAMDSEGNLFIADVCNSAVRKVDTRGIITTVAGTPPRGGGGFAGSDGRLATSTFLADPSGVAVDSAGNLFISDTGNYVIRKVNAEGLMTIVAGSTNEYGGHSGGYSGDGGPATKACFNSPGGIAIDHAGNLYIADIFNDVVRKVDAHGTVSTLTGDHTPVQNGLGYTMGPDAVAVDENGHLFIAYTKKSVVERVEINH